MTAPSNKQIRCLFSAVEADPFVKVGGLGDVSFALPNAIKSLSTAENLSCQFDIRLMLPCHSTACHSVENMANRIDFAVPTKLGLITTSAFITEINRLPIYLISSPLIPSDTGVYSQDNYNDGLKFFFFSMATLYLAKELGWQPDIVHVNDWHTAITAHLLDGLKTTDEFFHNIKSILTIHNLPFMGSGTENAIQDLGIPFRDDALLPDWARKIPLPMGISACDHIVAVSPTYAQEILTPEFGCGLEKYLRGKQQSLSGIINGVDVHAWNPATDQQLFVPYSAATLPDRKNNKHVLQNEMNLPIEPDIPLLIFIGRMDQQKGVDIILKGLHLCKETQWQAIILGTGNKELENEALRFQEEFPDRVRAIIRFDSKLSRRLYGGADILLMPSRYEPCGLAQMIAMRYGCVPLARSTGGLKDTILDYRECDKPNGFLFGKPEPHDFSETLNTAISIFQNKPLWQQIQLNGMAGDFSWYRSALSYAKLYLM